MLRFRVLFLVLLIGGSFAPFRAGSPYAKANVSIPTSERSALLQIPAKIDEALRKELLRLRDALNKRDIEGIKNLIHPSRVYVELEERQGAYLTTNQTLAVIESFFRTRTVLSAGFDFIDSDDKNATASGGLTVRKDGRTLNYRTDFGFVRADKQRWYLSSVHIQ